MSSAAPPVQASNVRLGTTGASGGTAAALPDLAKVRGSTVTVWWGSADEHPSFITALQRRDEMNYYLLSWAKPAAASNLSVPLPRAGRHITPDEFDAMLFRKGILAGVPTPRPITTQDEARLREVPPTFRRRRSITEIIREARDRR